MFLIISSFLSFVVPKTTAASSLTNGLIGFWKLEETSGTRIDNVGGNNLSDTNAVGSAAGKVGNAASFNGTNKYLSTPDNPSLSTGDVDFTISAWVYINSLPTTSFQDYVTKWDAYSNKREYLLIYYYSAQRFGFVVSKDGINTGTVVLASSPKPPQTGVWYFLVAWHDSVNNTINIQVNNGTPSKTLYSAGVFDSTAPFTIGKRYSGPTAYMNGKIDAVGFWKRVLTSAERTELYNLGNGLEYPFSTSQEGSVTITSPVDYRVFQRDGSNRADITVTGTYTGSPTAIEASWNGGVYSTIVSSPSGGSFSGTLTNQTAGQGTLTVRFADDSAVIASKNYIGVGDIFIVAGQSNAVGQSGQNQVYSHPSLKASLFGNDDKWKELVDPTDSPVNQVDPISSDSSVGGSVWPRLATLLLANQDVPVAFIPTAQGGTSIEMWQKTSTRRSGGLNLYESMARRINAVGGRVKAVLLWQGERNASACDNRWATCEVTIYKNLLTTFANNISTDFGTKTVVAQIGNRDGATSVGLNNVRVAQQSAWDDGVNILPGPALYDVDLYTQFVGAGEDGTHFRSDADLQIAANRWWAAISSDFYGGNFGRGPKVTQVESNAQRNKIAVSFTTGSLPVKPPATSLTGFTVLDNGVQKTISSITQDSSDRLLINLDSSASGTLTLSLKTSSSAPFAPWPTVPTDNSQYILPAEVFIDLPVSTSSNW